MTNVESYDLLFRYCRSMKSVRCKWRPILMQRVNRRELDIGMGADTKGGDVDDSCSVYTERRLSSAFSTEYRELRR